MHTALRPYATAGVALVGASVIAISPIAPPLPDIHIAAPHVSASVELTQFVNPITTWVDVITNTFANVAGLGQEILANPAPILQVVIGNQIGYAQQLVGTAQTVATDLANALSILPSTLQTAFTQLSSGDIFNAIQTVWLYAVNTLESIGLALVFGVFPITSSIGTNFDAVITILPLVLGLAAEAPLRALNSLVGQFAATTEGIFTAAGSGDFVTALSDIVNAPALLTGAFLNGFQGTFGAFLPGQGLLTNPNSAINPNDFGTIQDLLTYRAALAGSITPFTPTDPPAQSSTLAAPNVAPNLAANTATVNTKQTQAPAPMTTAPAVGSGPTTGVTNGNKVAAGNGTKATGNQLSSTLSKITAGLTKGTSPTAKTGTHN